jgi:hypothetical protein
MTSEIFNYIGLDQIDPAIILISLLVLYITTFLLVIIQHIKLNKIKKAYEKFMRGKNVRSLENEIAGLFEDIDFLKKSFQKTDLDIKEMKQNLLIAYQKVGIVHYDAFREMGGKLSFSIALLNNNNDGYILNSVHSTEGCYTYTKEVVGGSSYITLGEEEKEALTKAINCNVRSNIENDEKK